MRQNSSNASLCNRSRPSEPNTATASFSLSSVAFCTPMSALYCALSCNSSVMSLNSNNNPPRGCGWRTTRNVRPPGTLHSSSGGASSVS
jgi:hypothetical protein